MSSLSPPPTTEHDEPRDNRLAPKRLLPSILSARNARAAIGSRDEYLLAPPPMLVRETPMGIR